MSTHLPSNGKSVQFHDYTAEYREHTKDDSTRFGTAIRACASSPKSEEPEIGNKENRQ